MPIPAMQLLEIIMRGTVPQSSGRVRVVSNIFHYRNPGVVGAPTLSQVCDSFNSIVQTAIVGLLSPSYTHGVTLIRDMADDRNIPLGDDNNTVDGGGTAGDRLPLSQCVCMIMQTPVRGRGRQGRKFFAPIPEADTLLDDLTAGKVTAWQSIQATIVSNITDGGINTWNQIVLSRQSLVYSSHVLQSFDFGTVTSAALDKNIKNLKRRRDIVQR